MKMRNNWSAKFEDASGGRVFLSGGYYSPMTMATTTPETFLNKALVNLEEVSLIKSSGSPGDLSNAWAKVVVDAPEFGVDSHVFERKDISAATLKWAKDTAENNQATGPMPTIL